MQKTAPTKLQVKRVKKHSKLNLFIVLLLVIGGVGLLVVGGLYLYSKFAPQSNLAEHLPADETVMYVEMDGLGLPEKLSSGEGEMVSALSQWLDFDVKPAVDAFGTGQLAYVLLDVEGEDHKSLLFIQSKSKGAAIDYFKTLKLEGEELSDDENAIYTFSQGQPYSFKFFDRYVAISPDETLLERLEVEPGHTLAEDPDYMKTVNNLPRNKWIFGYLNVEKMSLTQDAAVRNLLEPLKAAMRHFAFTVRQDQDGFLFNTYLNVDKNLLSLLPESEAKKFNHALADYLPDENVALYLGGVDLSADWRNTLDAIEQLNPSYSIILEGLLRAQTDKVFGSDVDLENDLYPLFEGEYALMLGQNADDKEMMLVVAHENKALVQKKMEKLAKGFETIAASFEPRVSVVTLPDGTESRELVPDDTKLEKTTEKVNGFEVTCTEVGTKAAFCYTITDEIFIMASQKHLLEMSLDSANSMLSENQSFRKATDQLSQATNEITHLNFDRLFAFFNDQTNPQLLEPIAAYFDSATWVKQVFDDGMSMEGYILLK